MTGAATGAPSKAVKAMAKADEVVALMGDHFTDKAATLATLGRRCV
jgi:hypothetical protein